MIQRKVSNYIVHTILLSLIFYNTCFPQTTDEVFYFKKETQNYPSDLSLTMLNQMKSKGYLKRNQNFRIYNIYATQLVSKISKEEFENGNFLKNLSLIPLINHRFMFKKDSLLSAETILSYDNDSTVFIFQLNHLQYYYNCYYEQLNKKLLNYFIENKIEYAFRITNVDFNSIFIIQKEKIYVILYSDLVINKLSLSEYSANYWNNFVKAFR
jgi:hypothetical protein